MRRKKNLITAIIVFCIILCAGIVYAATNGSLSFFGTVNIGDDVRVEYTDLYVISMQGTITSDDIKQMDYTLNGNQRIEIAVDFHEPGDKVDFMYTVKNVGNVNAVLSDELDDHLFFNGTKVGSFFDKSAWGGLRYYYAGWDIAIPVGSSRDHYFYLQWDRDSDGTSASVKPGIYSLEINVPYEKTTALY